MIVEANAHRRAGPIIIVRKAVLRRFDFRLHLSLPKLSWCARVPRGGDVITVHHGPWVVTDNEHFFEGAWDGPFEEGQFDQAITFAGSGGRLIGEGVLFASATNLIGRVYSIRLDTELLFSNSLTFLLVQADDAPDPNYPHYYFDFVEHIRVGIQKTDKPIPTRAARKVYLHDCGNILVRQDLSIQRIEKNVPPPPVDYQDYFNLLSQSVEQITVNATHPARQKSYRPVVTLSKGYDSNCAAVLAKRVGCTEAATLAKMREDDCGPDDSGAEIAQQLGMRVTEYDRLSFLDMPGFPEAEFTVYPGGMDVVMAPMADQLEGALLLTGIHGDVVWNTDPKVSQPYLMEPAAFWLSGRTMYEFRLRTGFIHLPVPFIGAIHCRRIFEISTSQEMKPWSVGGEYDRPIPRRILEEAGVPRDLFGQTKQAVIHALWNESSLSENSREDFLRFYLSVRPPVSRRRRWGFGVMRGMYHLNEKMSGPLGALARCINPHAVITPAVHIKYRNWPSKLQYTFHWGFDRIKDRYIPSTNNVAEQSLPVAPSRSNKVLAPHV